jgi:hypothetical protein
MLPLPEGAVPPAHLTACVVPLTVKVVGLGIVLVGVINVIDVTPSSVTGILVKLIVGPKLYVI